MKNIKAISFLLAVLMTLSSFTISAFALEIEDASEDGTTEETATAAVTWEDVIAGMATPEEYCEANGVSDLSTELGGEASTTNLTVEDGLYYINNKYTGKYMYYSSSSVTSKSGLTSSLGSYARWGVYETDNGYVIYSSFNGSKFLAVSTSSTNGVEIVTVTSSQEMPETCYWDMSVAAGGGILIQSMYNSRYLYASGTSLYTASSTGTSGTSTYYSRAWRFVSKSNMSSREMTSFTVDTCTILAGESKTPTINPTPSNAYWTRAYDFSYSGYSTTYTSFSSSTGKFTCKNYDCSSFTITATHKPTGLTATFVLATNPLTAMLVGITVTGHNHSSLFTSVQSTLTKNFDYSSATINADTYTAEKVAGFLDDDSYNIFVSRSHGNCYGSSYTYIITSGSSTSDTYHLTSKDLKSYDLSNMKLIMFVACYTGYGGKGSNNLPTVAVTQGAATAIGFEKELVCSTANAWTIEFFDWMKDGYTVLNACKEMGSSDLYRSTTMTSYIVCGDTSATFY
ncbi:MAG: hypothetical protein LUH43_08025 [Clostridia bacterium]|nr:hypothetical protein [Clostridia bacterium]